MGHTQGCDQDRACTQLMSGLYSPLLEPCISHCKAAHHLTVLAACLRLPSEISLPPLAIFFTARWIVLIVLSV